MMAAKIFLSFGILFHLSAMAELQSSEFAPTAECVSGGSDGVLCNTLNGKLIGELNYQDKTLIKNVTLELILITETVPILDAWGKTGDCRFTVSLDFGNDRVDLMKLGYRFTVPNGDSFKQRFIEAGASGAKAQELSEKVMTELTAIKEPKECRTDSDSVKALHMVNFKAAEMFLYEPYNSSGPGYGGKIRTVGFDLLKTTHDVALKALAPAALKTGRFRTHAVKNGPELYFAETQGGGWYRLMKQDFGRYKAQLERAYPKLEGKLKEQKENSYFEGAINGTTYVAELGTEGVIAVAPTFDWYTFDSNFIPAGIDAKKMSRLMMTMPGPIWAESDARSLYEALATLISSRKFDFVKASVVMENKSKSVSRSAAAKVPAGLEKEPLDKGEISFTTVDGGSDFSADIGLGRIYLERANGKKETLTWDGCHFAKMDRYQWMAATAPDVRGHHAGFWNQLEQLGLIQR